MRFFLLFLLSFHAYAGTYYVTTSGGTGAGTLGDPWNLSHAIATAVAGDVVYVKAGNYGNLKLFTARSGTAGNPIKFIGYTTTPGDIVSNLNPTYSIFDWVNNSQLLDSSVMPLLDNNPTNANPAGSDIAFSINHNYIEIHNFMVQEYMMGYNINADNITLDNVIGFKFGNWNPNSNCWESGDSDNCDNRNGYGIRVQGGGNDNAIIRNSMIIDAGIDAIFIVGGTNHLIEGSKAYTYNPGNGTDYLINLTSGVTNSTVRNCYAERTYTSPSTAHKSRGLAVKCGSTGNTLENIEIKNTRVYVLQASGNRFNDIYVHGNNAGDSAEFQIIGDSHNNVVTNLEVEDGGPGISFLQYIGNDCGDGGGLNIGGASNNYFINPILHDFYNGTGVAAVSFHRQSNSPTTAIGINYVIGGTIHDVGYIVNANRDGTIVFINTSFSTIYNALDVFYAGFSDYTDVYTGTYINCNFANLNGFLPPSGTSITTHDPPQFTSPGIDYTLQPGSPLEDIGTNPLLYTSDAGIDFYGNIRTSPHSIGAFIAGSEPGGGGPDPGATVSGSVQSLIIQH